MNQRLAAWAMLLVTAGLLLAWWIASTAFTMWRYEPVPPPRDQPAHFDAYVWDRWEHRIRAVEAIVSNHIRPVVPLDRGLAADSSVRAAEAKWLSEAPARARQEARRQAQPPKKPDESSGQYLDRLYGEE